MDNPLSTFTGTLRQISPKSLNPVGQAFLYLCAPKFLPSTKEQLEQRWKEAQKDLSPYITHVYLPERPYRRWSGDFPGEWDDQFSLDRGNYFSVCQNDDGYDAGTLEAELNAYRNPEEDFYVIFMDGLIEGNSQRYNMQPSAHIIAVLTHPGAALQRLPENAPAELYQLMKDADGKNCPLVITLGNVISSAQIEGVVDLRQRDAQRWLFAKYVNTGIIPTQATNFLDILPELLHLNLGGCDGTVNHMQKIGADLRKAGVNGLIFPSARIDVGVAYDSDAISRFKGWNMVIFNSKPPRETLHVDMGGWETEFLKGIKIHKETDSYGRISQWYVEGLDNLNMARYDYKMRLKGIIHKKHYQ